jgi:glyoxylase-like metal-dependent hydrolase (beta-lactamase superfamily II)
MIEAAEPHLSRRMLLRSAVAGACGLACARRFSFAEDVAAPLALHALDDRVAIITGAGANVVVVAAAADALVLVDGGLPERSAEVLELVASTWPGRPIRALLNTNWRSEHTGSNEALGRRGTTIIAHENTKLWLGADFTIEWDGDRVHAPRPPEAMPTKTFYTQGALELGGEPVEYVHVPQAHTDGDLYVHVPRSNVLVVSDLLSVGAYPLVDYVTGGWLGGMANAARRLLDIADAGTKIVPAVGPVQTRAQLVRYHDMCLALKDRVGGMLKSGLSLEEVLAARPTREYDGEWGNPELFLTLAYRGLWGHVRELGGVL